ncbi:MAG: extracellular solute-binding protein family 5 [Marmoricola sp.]|nr:extracellular solute-binding protein family 5 [Marmoricola sp.]
MANYRKKALAVAVAASMSVALAACGSGSSNSPSASGKGGGTLTYYVRSTYDHNDPQRTYLGVELANWNRMVYRSLVSFPMSSDPAVAAKPVPDLATDTGTSSDNAKTWKFTVKDGVKWQDGKPITCEDFKYGASRVFATDVITGGPNYILTYLDVPLDPKTGLPAYKGPYTTANNDVAAFNKAITCDGNTITYHFKKPWPDFPLAVASLHMMDPYRKDKDQGDKSNYQIFSNGPYELQGAWDKEKGGTFVRNPNYDPATDSTDIRKALPSKIIFDIGKTSEQITDQLIADRGADQGAVTQQSIPSSKFSQITGAVADRSVSVESPFVDYLVPNMKRLTNPVVRQAIAVATDDTGWVAAGGGPKSYKPATDIVNPAVSGYQSDLFPGGGGDPAKAKALLTSAGVKMPYPITYSYPSTPTADTQARALQAGWEKAGFKVTLDGVADSDTYYTNIQEPDQTADLDWAGWGADWPSAITVTAPLFDSRPNLTANSNGQDYGAYKSDAFNALVDQAQASASIADQTKYLQQADQVLAKDVAYIPLDIPIFFMLHGSKVMNYTTDPASSSYPELGAIDVSSSVK